MNKYKIWTVDQLQKHIYHDGEFDKRFLPHRDGGVFNFFAPNNREQIEMLKSKISRI